MNSQRRPLYIALRQSPDWANQTYADLDGTRSFCRLIGRPETFIIDRVHLWDRTFGISFFAARQRMKDISQDNFRRVQNAALVPVSALTEVPDRKAFYLFTDDDDWYHPQIADHLAPIDPRACDVILWLTATLGPGLTPMEGHYACSTNGYAVSGEVLLQKKGNLQRVTQHFDAHATFVRKSYPSVLRRIGYASLYRRLTVSGYRSIVRVPTYLSMTNKHPASTLSLEEISNREELIAQVRSGFEANRTISLDERCRWAGPYIERVTGFMDELLSSIR